MIRLRRLPDICAPAEPAAGQQFDRAAVEARMHAIAVEFDFMEPIWPVGRLVDQLGELRFDTAGSAVASERR
jgi:hypothetical protein